MANELYRLRALDGGLVSAIPSTSLDQEQGFASHIMDADLSQPGRVRKRPGAAHVLSALAVSPSGLHEFIRTDTGDRYILAAHGEVVQRWDEDTQAWADVKADQTAGHTYDFLNFANSVLIGNGEDETFRWDGTDVTTPGIPKTNKMTDFRLRAVVVVADDPLLLKASSTGDPTLWDPKASGSNAFEAYVSPDDGQRITGILAVEDYVLIGKEQQLFGLFGIQRSNFAILGIDSSVGVGSHHAMCGIGSNAFFPDAEGNIYQASPGIRPELLSVPVQDLIDQVNPEFIEQARAVVYPRRRYVVSLPAGANGTDRITLVYDTVRERWYRWSLAFGEVMEIRGKGIYWVPPGAMRPLTLDSALLNDEAGPIQMRLDTARLDLGMREVDKDIKDLYLFCAARDEKYHIDLFVSVDDSPWEQLIDGAPVTGDLEQIVMLTAPVGRTGRFFRFRIENSREGQGVDVLSMSLTFTPKDLL